MTQQVRALVRVPGYFGNAGQSAHRKNVRQHQKGQTNQQMSTNEGKPIGHWRKLRSKPANLTKERIVCDQSGECAGQ